MKAEELERLHEAATGAPWDYTHHEDEIELFDAGELESGKLYPSCDELYIYANNSSLICKEDDLRLIVALRNALPDIIATYRERDSYKAALGDVSNPLRYLERQAEEAGRSLGPMAYTIANDLPFVQSIARTALERRGSE